MADVVAAGEVDGDTVLDPLPVPTTVCVPHPVEERDELLEMLCVEHMVLVTLPEREAEVQGVGVIEGV